MRFSWAVVVGAVAGTAWAGTKPVGWRNESELSVARATGNAETETYAAKQSTGYQFAASLVRLSGHYLYGTARGVENARNWDVTGRFEKDFGKSAGGYFQTKYESDPFVGFDLRLSAGTGVKYYLRDVDRDENYVFGELGYTYAHEERTVGNPVASLISHFARGYLEARLPATETTTLRADVEVLQDLAHTDNLQINFDAGVEVAMTRILALKASYGGRYRRTPAAPGNRNFDTLLAVALIAKFVPETAGAR